ncbi:SIMPL domain-containing protein [Solirubrobacter sp. CPCC 204708]|uniref:SIMPL domain-containing protein n=1 Tax=Solirubrobacter deserti TaxID=2282478 RepID=A0ABT4RQ45_9ACTN|nr:SIMPL domain-containing protein [Solirubrobacter deserti]MBE2318262.1 SIMPL domain-containing protein [Solirubrobacter deserti]MDA0140600.1 SIMPL domain-containing protein [Solirubrobacter deserti]
MTLTVLGEASGELEPDRVLWTLTVHAVDRDARNAFGRCADRLAALTAALDTADVATGAVEVGEEYDDRSGKMTGRRAASGSVSAIAPIADAGALATAALQAGADELAGPALLYPEAGPLMETLLAEAVVAARRAAERTAEAAERRLGRALTIEDRRVPDPDLRQRFTLASRRAGRHHEDMPVLTRPQRLTAAVVA